jgi:hypothetical protein
VIMWTAILVQWVQWWPLVNMVMNLRVPQKMRISLFDQLSYCLLPKDCSSMGLLNMISSTEWHLIYLEELFSYYFFKLYSYSFLHTHFSVGQDIAL